jgi:Integrase zinc binding domain
MPVTPPPEPALPEIMNRPSAPSPDENFSITIDKYAEAIREGYKTDRLFSKALSIVDTNAIYHVDPATGFLYQNHPSGPRLCIPNVRISANNTRAQYLRDILIDHVHETLGHFGFKKTTASMSRHFYWKTLIPDVLRRLRKCHDCQVAKKTPTARRGLAKPLPTAQRPWSIISMDFMNLPTSQDDAGNKYDYLYVVCCTLSKMVHLIPTTKHVTAQQVARLYYDYIYRLHGLPQSIISDRDTKFTGDFWSTMQKLFGTDLLMSTAYHPRTDGQTERTNRTILQTLRHYVNRNGSNWAKYITTVEFAINSAINSSTGKAPFEIVYGYLPRILPPAIYDDSTPAAMDFVEARMLHHLEAQDAVIAAKTEQSERTNRQRIDPETVPLPINVGEYVLRKSHAVPLGDKPAKKLLLPWIGPYKVVWHDPTRTTYQLDLGHEKAHPYFHVDQIKLYTGDPTSPQRRPRISLSVNEDNLQIDRILGHRFKFNDGLQFLCQYKDYSPDDATYRKAMDFVEPTACILVARYLRGFKELPRDLRQWTLRTPWAFDLTGRLAPGAKDSTHSTPSVNYTHPSRARNRTGIGFEDKDLFKEGRMWRKFGSGYWAHSMIG